MITIYTKKDDDLHEVPSIENECWINIAQPNYTEISEISKKLDIPEEFLTDPLDTDERSRVEIEDNHLLIILRIPYFDKEHPETPYNTVPLGIILSPQTIITISSMNHEIHESFLGRKIKNLTLKNKQKFILTLLLKTALLYLKYLKQINNITGELEKELHKSMKNRELIKLLDLEKSLVYFTTSLKANELMILRLARTQKFRLTEEDQDLLEDVIVEYKQAIEMANVYSNILSGMMDAFASVISNNLNVVMKFLTSITFIIMLPTLVASIYGMNVDLPFQKSQNAFLIVVFIAALSAIMGAIFVINRKWFRL